MIYCHIGAHKTASTYLQDLLDANQGRVASAGRAYWKQSRFRLLIDGLLRTELWRAQRDGKAGNNVHDGLPSFRQLIDALPDCVISEENIIGYCIHALGGTLYPHALNRLRNLSAAFGERESEIWLSVRSYDTFLAAAFCETLRSGHSGAVPTLLEANRALPVRRWPALLADVRAAFPESRIVVWDHAMFRSLEPVIVSRLSGVPFHGLHKLDRDVWVSPSAAAVEAHCARLEGMTGPQRIMSMAMCEDSFPLSQFPLKFYPWDAEFAEKLRSAYSADLEAISRLPNVELLG